MAESNTNDKTVESSLTAPADRDPKARWRPSSDGALTADETKEAFADLNNTDYIRNYPSTDRTYADPPLSMQTIGLVSFIPAKGATPNKNGVYGFAKLRGNFSTTIEADQRAEYLIRNADSYHQIYHTYVGRPFPMTASSKYSAETKEIDIRKEAAESISDSIKKRKKADRREVEEIKEREKRLKEDVSKDEDPYDRYITLRVKKAQLTWTYLEHQKKMAEVKDLIINARKDISELDEEHEDFKHNYFKKYMDARKEAGIKESKDESADNFMKYMVEDVDLGF
jgi:hypothetical protein